MEPSGLLQASYIILFQVSSSVEQKGTLKVNFIFGFRSVNLLKRTGFVHQQFNIQQLYALPTLCLCVLYLSENKQRLVPLTA